MIYLSQNPSGRQCISGVAEDAISQSQKPIQLERYYGLIIIYAVGTQTKIGLEMGYVQGQCK
jgi:hypothetical protein